MLIGGMVDNELDNHPHAAPLGFDNEAAKILHGPEIGIDRSVIGNVVAVVAAGRGEEWQQPERRYAEFLQVVELFGEAGEIADTVIIAVGEGLDVKLIDNGVFVPKLIVVECSDR